MSTKKYAHVQKIFDGLIQEWNLKGYSALAEFLGVQYQTLMAWKKRNSIGDFSPFMDKGILKQWLETGEGQMFIPAKINLSVTPEDIKQALKRIAETPTTEEDCQHVDIFNMVEAGNGAEPDWHEPIDTRIIPTHLLKRGIRAVLVRGRSMEPTFKNGAVIGVNEIDKSVIEGEAYAVVLPYSGASVKRLYPVPDGVIIRSDNKEFPEVKLMRGDIPDYFILGRVCWVVQEI